MTHLHIVSFNVPWPADYGGVIDVYNRIRFLSDEGVRIHLHCYTYGREESAELADLCEEVHYYRRATGMVSQLNRRPYIVASRRSEELIARLQQDDYPILLEGLHNGYVLERLADGKRDIVLRAHNVEHDYYASLCHAARNPWKRLFFAIEAAKLRRYEPVLLKASRVLAISESDAAHFRAMGCNDVRLLGPSHGHRRVTTATGRGDYALYQGDLSTPENEKAALYIVDELAGGSGLRIVLAGKNPGQRLQARVAQCPQATLIANPDDETMHSLLRDAQVNLLFTHQATGVKLKLMNALYEGRHCLVNSTMVAGTRLAEACHVADSPEEQRVLLRQLASTEFDDKERERRCRLLEKYDPLPEVRNIIL